jgi:photosystem II stability/assembly factor-like uncharacterized protein
MLSTNAGTSWTLSRINTLAGSEATSAAFAPNDTKVLYVGGRTDAYKALVYRTANGGASWTDVTGGDLQSPPNAVAVDPLDPDIAYLACNDGLWRTANAGASWTKCAIENSWSMKGIAVNPNNPQQVFAGNSYGVHISQNRGLTWTDISQGLTVPYVTGLYFNPGNKTLYAATEGGGLWKRAM